jgi:hypothetical protein
MQLREMEGYAIDRHLQAQKQPAEIVEEKGGPLPSFARLDQPVGEHSPRSIEAGLRLGLISRFAHYQTV